MTKRQPIVAVTGFGLLLTSSTLAQDDPTVPMDGTQPVARTSAGGANIALDAALAYQFEANLDTEGEYSVLRSGVRLNIGQQLSDSVGLSITGRYRYDDFDFGGDALGIADAPWGEIHTTGFDALFEIGLSREWSVFVGPTIQASWESGAEFDESISYGALVGFSYRVSEDLKIGALVSIRDQIEDDVDVIGIPLIEWDIADNWRIGSVGGPSSFLVSGLQLTYDPDDEWRFGLGAGYSKNRFRLDEDGPVPDGVGEETGVPIWFGVGYRPSNQFEVDFLAGLLVGGNLQLEDEDGSLIEDDDVDPAPFIGIAARIRF